LPIFDVWLNILLSRAFWDRNLPLVKIFMKLYESPCMYTIIYTWTYDNNNSSLFNEFVCNLGSFRHEWVSLKLEWNESFKGPRLRKKAQITQERVEYNVFLFDESPKGSKSLKIFKISWRFVLTSCQIYQNPFTQE
jgi:hypothetical protein